MAQSNLDRVGRVLELLNRGLQPFVERELKAVYQNRWLEAAQDGLGPDRNSKPSGAFHWEPRRSWR